VFNVIFVIEYKSSLEILDGTLGIW